MGTRLRLKSSFDVSGFSAANQVILNAMKKYGLLVADNGSAMFISGAPDDRWDNDDLHKLGSVPASAFEVIQMGTQYTSKNIPSGAAPQIDGLTASSMTVSAGTPVTLSWSVAGASYSFISPEAGPVRGATTTVKPTATTMPHGFANAHGPDTNRTSWRGPDPAPRLSVHQPAPPDAGGPTVGSRSRSHVKVLTGNGIGSSSGTVAEVAPARRLLARLATLAGALIAVSVIAVSPAHAGYQKVLTIGGHGTGNGRFKNEIGGVAVGGNSIYATDFNRDRVEAFFPDGAFRAAWGGPGDSGHYQFDNPAGVATSPGGNVYVVDYGHDRVEKFTDTGQYLWSRTKGKEDFSSPVDVAVNDGTGTHSGQVYVSDNWQLLTDNPDGRIQRLSAAGDALTTWVLDPPDWSALVGQGLGVGPTGKVWVTAFRCSGDIQDPVCPTDDNRVIEYGAGGGFVRDWQVPPTPNDVAISKTGKVLIVGGGGIGEYTQAGMLIRTFGSTAGLPSIAIDSAGAIYVTQAHSIYKYAPVHPGTHITAGPSGRVKDTGAHFKYSTQEPNVTIECRLDNESYHGCPKSGKSYSYVPDGKHTFRVRATDLDGFATTAVRTWTKDTIRPTTTITAGPANDSVIKDPTPTLKFHASEQDVHFGCRRYSAKSGQWTKWVKCSSPHTTAPLSDDYHVWEVRATDAAGNREDPETDGAFRRFTVDTKAPDLKISSADETLAGGKVPVKLTCPASEANGPCAGKLSLKTAHEVQFNGQQQIVFLGSADFSIPTDSSQDVGVYVPQDKRQLIHSLGHVPVRARAEVHDAAQNNRKVTQEITVRSS